MNNAQQHYATQAIQESVYRGLSDSLHCCIETGNRDEGLLVLEQALEAYRTKQLNAEQLAELRQDFYQGLPDESIR